MIVLLTVSAGTVMAGQKRAGGGGAAPKGGCVFALVGQVTAVINDVVDGVEVQEIHVQVVSGNRLVKDHIGTELKISITDATPFRYYLDPGSDVGFEDVEFGDVEAGDGAYVSVGGCVDVDGFVAERVTVNAPVDCL